MYEYFPNKKIDLYDLIALNFAWGIEGNDSASNILETWLVGEEYNKYFENNSSYFTVDPETSVEFEIISNRIKITFYVAVMTDHDITDGDWGTITIKGGKIEKFFYHGYELD